MAHETIKSELIQWLRDLNDQETLEYLKEIKDSKEKDNDWWNDLTSSQKESIERGLEDINLGRTISHDEVKKRYGL